MNKNRFMKGLALLSLVMVVMLISVACSGNKVEIKYLENEKKVEVKTEENTWLTITIAEKSDEEDAEPVYQLIHQGRTDEEGLAYFDVDLAEGTYIAKVNAEDKPYEEELVVGQVEEAEITDGKVDIVIGADGESVVDKKGIEFEAGDTALDIIEKVLEDEEIELLLEDDEITAIGALANGEDQAWIFNINGRAQDSKPGEFELRDKDLIELIYGETEDAESKEDTEEIENLLDETKTEPYIDGYKDGTFRPTDNATREQVASMIYKVMNDKVIDENNTEENDYTDVPDYKWSREFIATLAKMDIITGYEDSTFKPEENITRGEVAVILGRVAGLEEIEGSGDFNDVEDYWGVGFVNAVANEGWVQGYKTGEFRPNAPVTRAELVTMLNNALNRPDNPDAENTFTDFDENNWFYEEVMKASSSE